MGKLFLTITLVLSTQAFAGLRSFDGLGFVVPGVTDRNTVLGPQTGDLIYENNGSAKNLYINEGTSASPTWTSLADTRLVPTEQVFTVSGTYTVPTPAPIFIRVRMVGGGGGGAGSGSASWGTAGAGGDTTFGTGAGQSKAGGGAAASGGNNSGALGGTASLGSGWIGTATPGNNGGTSSVVSTTNINAIGGAGGNSLMGPGGIAGGISPGVSAPANSGGGGGGAGGGAIYGGSGGGAGAYVEGILSNPTAGNTYTVIIGSGGAGGSAGTGGQAGGSGGSGRMIVDEFYQ